MTKDVYKATDSAFCKRHEMNATDLGFEVVEVSPAKYRSTSEKRNPF